MADYFSMSDKQKDLEVLVAADSSAWLYPSPARDLRVHELERDYAKKWGESAPAWPARGRW
jgi:hypothetical protein